MMKRISSNGDGTEGMTPGGVEQEANITRLVSRTVAILSQRPSGVALTERRPVAVRRASDAQRLLSRLITEFQRGTVANQDAKDMAYLLSIFIQIAQATDIEKRLGELEARLDGK